MRDHNEDHDDEPAEVAPLAGFTVAVTAARRADDLAALLTRRGATVVLAPALRLVPLFDDAELMAVTRQMLADPPEKVVATTAIGFRGWIEAADGWGLGEELRRCLDGVELLARGPKVRGAIRAAGLTDAWSPPSESMAEVLDRLLDEGVQGRRIAVQLHGEPLPGIVESLREAGAEPLGIPVYRWLPPTDTGPMDRLLDSLVGHGVDAVTFTSAPAAVSLLDRATQRGMREDVLEAFRRRVLPACVGPVTATVLESRGVPTVQPERYRLGPLAQLVVAELPARVRPLPVAGHRLEVRGHAVLVDGELRCLAPAGMSLLRTLARRPGFVVSRADLLAALPGAGTDEHAVETAMARLRGTLGKPRMIQTVVKRGYRLALDTSSQDDDGCMSRPSGTE